MADPEGRQVGGAGGTRTMGGTVDLINILCKKNYKYVCMQCVIVIAKCY